MIPAKDIIKEVVTSLREVIAPAIADPYPKSQAYMAAVVLEFVARQVDERRDIEAEKHAALMELLRDLSQQPEVSRMIRVDHLSEAGLCELIESLYAARERLGEDTFASTSRRIRQTLRTLLDAELKVAGKAEG